MVGDIARQRGELDEARRILDDAMGMARKFDNVQSLLYVNFALARIELDEDDPRGAAPFLRDSLTMGEELGAEVDVADSLEAAARVAAALDDAASACRFLGAGDALRSRLGVPRDVVAADEFAALVAAVRAGAASDADAAWAEGAAWSFNAAIGAAVAFLEQAATPSA
jgi:hypothetical protein